jgi:calcineurin-like phosphoesterase family protein
MDSSDKPQSTAMYPGCKKTYEEYQRIFTEHVKCAHANRVHLIDSYCLAYLRLILVHYPDKFTDECRDVFKYTYSITRTDLVVDDKIHMARFLYLMGEPSDKILALLN